MVVFSAATKNAKPTMEGDALSQTLPTFFGQSLAPSEAAVYFFRFAPPPIRFGFLSKRMAVSETRK
jgi:hypothetical protein